MLLNYNDFIKKLFGVNGIDKHLSFFSLQFQLKKNMQINLESLLILLKYRSYNDFDNELTDQDYNNIRYSYRLLYVPKK
jgi:hypothetical protein